MIVFRLFLTAYLNTLPVRSYCRMLTIFLWSIKYIEQILRIELRSPDWKSGVITVIRYLHFFTNMSKSFFNYSVNIQKTFDIKKYFMKYFSFIVERAGFEPATPASSVQCSTNWATVPIEYKARIELTPWDLQSHWPPRPSRTFLPICQRTIFRLSGKVRTCDLVVPNHADYQLSHA